MSQNIRRNRPGTASQAAPKSIAVDLLNLSPDRWHSTPTAAERQAANLLAELDELNFGYKSPYRVSTVAAT